MIRIAAIPSNLETNPRNPKIRSTQYREESGGGFICPRVAHPWKSWISSLPLNGLNLPPATQITNGNIRKLHERLQPRQNRKKTNQKKKYQSGIVVCVTDVCGFFNGLAFLMTADLDAQPRLTKHFDSPFVVRLRLCFSPFFFF